MADIKEQVLAELNLCRANPKAYATKLEKTLRFYKGKVFEKPGSVPIETEEGKENVQACISYLKTSRPLPQAQYNECLEKAAQDHLNDIGPSGLVGHIGSDGSSTENRIERYAEWQGSIGENIDYGNSTAEDIIVSLLVDDGVLDRGHRLNILNLDHILAGIAYGDHSDMGVACVIVFAQNLKPKEDSSRSQNKKTTAPKNQKATPVKENKPQAPTVKDNKTPAPANNQKSNQGKTEDNKPQGKAPLVRPKEEPKAFDPSQHSRPGFSNHDILELKEAFDLFDSDKSGSIEPSELKSVIEDFGFDAKNSAIFQMISDLDTDGSGKIEFNEFLDMISGNTADENSMEEIRKVFNIFDTDKTGFITIKNLREICDDLGEHYSDETLKNLIVKGDSNSDGLVSFEDFYYIMTKTVL
ncbi:hypothetical protein SteCoe_14273 [Stentor coeruleus]|uniref:EF-hand domain-containing protein n=1 Tax=Stentor coeruleus TaxID=5963 RepID=A0A1R2C6J6_9CILI|nr:hypothetical protein SteCoe_14273 [Stentor coeruleus]